ncbi:hypothetical protein R69776_05460 [Paraburkholderia nemoris]|uniref:Uncharacterized protein n=1 Tax=Paraburkholderia nemoris TaxID=2793076 RepID=A0ABM8SFJ8_9BURK|nr:hypothetical protein R75777_05447 [Paraburkholderia nemoris]CAE6806302.1 hypothetical protein R69776_05460 [Paraburkholderia nemoris]
MPCHRACHKQSGTRGPAGAAPEHRLRALISRLLSASAPPIGRTLPAWGSVAYYRSVQLPIDLLSKRLRNSFDARQILDAGRNHPTQPAEARQQPLTPLRAHSFEFFEP